MLTQDPLPLAGRAVVSLRLRLADAADKALGRHDRFTPPRRLRHLAGDSDFHQTGEEFGRLLRELAALAPSDRVLDIGCGAGRIARVLARELSPPGSYDGLDVIPDVIAWCRRHYRDTPAPFRFQHADVRSSVYNRHGAASATSYRFPYDDASFDLIVATSVFTHLLTDAAEHYLAEAKRVLAPGGRLFTTWFVLRPEFDGQPSAAIDFVRTTGPQATGDPELPEAAVAYDARWLYEQLEANDLRLRDEIHWGTWAGGRGTSYQDIVVASRDRCI